MKIVNAYVKPHTLSRVVEALHRIQGVSGVSVLQMRGFGRVHSLHGSEGADELGLLDPHDKVEVLCRDALAEAVVAAIETGAHTGLSGDGRIFVTAVEEVVRIATGERGEEAV